MQLAEKVMKLEQVMQLEEGDVLELGQPVTAPLLVKVQDKPIYLGEAGHVRQNRAVRLTQRIKEE